jgi:hypothetical protein
MVDTIADPHTTPLNMSQIPFSGGLAFLHFLHHPKVYKTVL